MKAVSRTNFQSIEKPLPLTFDGLKEQRLYIIEKCNNSSFMNTIVFKLDRLLIVLNRENGSNVLQSITYDNNVYFRELEEQWSVTLSNKKE